MFKKFSIQKLVKDAVRRLEYIAKRERYKNQLQFSVQNEGYCDWK
ncbi:hypothetical protein OTSGILL_1562 [Orientia tsutsugamushi str. Gilliam]|uniref:Uncharacterized protein n=1 Tax=Orientia tsutsugamushi str. Gilliam TaxID=1359184 RepID=A0A0F3MCR9_ORITS|nr:hypothetical protein [Orientia tsutsugamushi]KJV52364.1 hypothetical protein OTSGILL_1562 [Orientia tsutsugamushi str. Gilliam]